MNQDTEWFNTFRKSELYPYLNSRPVAYFCAEFALSDTIPVYAGGLGILAGDIVREAADQNFPLVAIGLYYHQGYVSQKIDENGNIFETYSPTQPTDVALELVVDENQKQILVSLPLQDRKINARAWKWQKGSVCVYLLDTDIAENELVDRNITNRLYVSDKETRLKQEIVLGIGGVRLLDTLGIHPSVYHMNEGHSAFLALELCRHEMEERKVGFETAKELARSHLVFTNHTLVSAGNEVFSNDLVSVLLSSYADELQVPTDDLIQLGLVQESSIFSLTMLSLRFASKINVVSRLHQKKAEEIWTDHAMTTVTNGVHIPTWDKLKKEKVLWEDHQHNKKLLIAKIAEVTGQVFLENELLLGWARRMVPYKRPLALFEDLQKFLEIAQNTNRPVRVVMSGFAPPGDSKGGELLQKLKSIIGKELSGIVVYLPNYNFKLAELLVAGCDVWLNTPVVGFEACGTSGMKAALNGVLPCTTKDGWVDEVELYKIGWILENDLVGSDLLKVLENNIIPLYYENKEEWKNNMQNSREMVLNQFSATKMLRGYIEKMYIPIVSGINH